MAGTVLIALLRGINVGGNKPVAMAALRDLLAKLGFGDARSILQSGNLVFRISGAGVPARHGPAGLESMLEAEAAKRLGLQADFLIRTAKEWRTVVSRNPFRKEAERDPSHLLVMFLKAAPKPSEIKAAHDAIVGRETIRADGRQMYIVYPDGIGRSRLTNVLLEKKLGVRGTARNWNTVLNLATLADELDGVRSQL
jgi:uncharacterized protein (DUF1697 family)